MSFEDKLQRIANKIKILCIVDRTTYVKVYVIYNGEVGYTFVTKVKLRGNYYDVSIYRAYHVSGYHGKLIGLVRI